MKIALDIHNLSATSDRILRTGIQELVFQLFKSSCEFSHPDIEILPIPWLPKTNYGNVLGYKPEHFLSPPHIVRETIRELGYSEDNLFKRWPWLRGFLSEDLNAFRKDRLFFHLLNQCDIFFEPALSDTRHVQFWMRRWNKKIRFGQHIHDLGPILYPEFVREGMSYWFEDSFLRSLRTSDFVISISRNTGIEALDFLGDNNVALHQYYVPLPTGKKISSQPNPQLQKQYFDFLDKFKIPRDADVFITLSTLEPRKNLEKTIEGFVRYQKLFPENKKSYLILSGTRGWKSERLDSLIAESGATIVTVGYISEDELNSLLAMTKGLAMLSHYEGFGIPIARARANGLPVLTAINSSLPEASALSDVFVSPFSVDEIGCGFARLQRATPLQNNQFAVNETWEQCFEGYVDCFKKVVAHANQPVFETEVNAPIMRSKPLIKRRRIAIDLHNCSVTLHKIRKTGIQEVAFNILKNVDEAQKKLGSRAEIVPIASFNSAQKRRDFYPTLNHPINDYKLFCDEAGFDFLKLNQQANLSFYGYSLALENVLRECDWLVLNSQMNAERVPHFNRIARSGTKFSFMVYDIIPTLQPEFASFTMQKWFETEYLAVIKRWANLAVCISRHSAIELALQLGPSFDGKILWEQLPWPTTPVDELPAMSSKVGFDVESTPYFVMIGSIDPRKNMLRVLSAFEKLKAHALPGSDQQKCKLVWIGATGWNHKHVLKIMHGLKSEGQLVCPGYLQDIEIDALVKNSAGLLMPSRYEGYGLPLAKAASLGVQTISCVNSSLPEVTLASNTLFINPSSDEEICLAMARTLASKPTRKVQNNFNFDWSDYLCRLVEMHYSLEN